MKIHQKWQIVWPTRKTDASKSINDITGGNVRIHPSSQSIDNVYCIYQRLRVCRVTTEAASLSIVWWTFGVSFYLINRQTEKNAEFSLMLERFLKCWGPPREKDPVNRRGRDGAGRHRDQNNDKQQRHVESTARQLSARMAEWTKARKAFADRQRRHRAPNKFSADPFTIPQGCHPLQLKVLWHTAQYTQVQQNTDKLTQLKQ